MRYASIFATILFIWIAIIVMAFTTNSASQIYGLYLAAMASTLALFVIGFARK
jgi:hypothetical protein